MLHSVRISTSCSSSINLSTPGKDDISKRLGGFFPSRQQNKIHHLLSLQRSVPLENTPGVAVGITTNLFDSIGKPRVLLSLSSSNKKLNGVAAAAAAAAAAALTAFRFRLLPLFRLIFIFSKKSIATARYIIY